MMARTALGKGIGVLFALSAATGLGVAHDAPVRAADADVYLMDAAVSATGVNPFLATATYRLVSGACLARPLPTGGEVPSYVDVASETTGVCTSVTGGGTVTGVCNTGVITANWSFSEPGESDNATMVGDGVVVQGIAIIVAHPSSVLPGDGYFDPSSSSTPGSAITVAAFTGNPTAVCGVDSNDLMTAVDAAVVASY